VQPTSSPASAKAAAGWSRRRTKPIEVIDSFAATALLGLACAPRAGNVARSSIALRDCLQVRVADRLETQAAAFATMVEQSVPVGKFSPRAKPLPTSRAGAVGDALCEAHAEQDPEDGKWRQHHVGAGHRQDTPSGREQSD